MRKRQQNQILELLQTLKEAQSAGLYGDCQEGALSVLSFIESVEGEDNPRVAGATALLSEYCELLYGAHKGEIGEKRLRKQLVRIENCVRSELAPDRIEMAFLSYNASMSDSIESVYLAAKADPGCDAYWIPIPYFECKPDGSLGPMRYEGAECYGDKTECVDWREYDIEARRPDAIFTFNPYDGGNLVTRVHPDFYCERLRDLTDALVYIPYFTTTDDVPEHFCTLAGCVFAHRVIVQSEKVRETYVRVFKKAYGDRFGRPEDKFVALGSPKFDKVVNAKREDFTLPNAWRELIERKDGTRKNVVLYNTTVSALLSENETHLAKLRRVFGTFKNRDDAVLWWRPHPLNEATYRAMRPRIMREYAHIADSYRSEAFGIHDDTPNPHRAISLSDAYYGDGGSMFAMYGLTGKPMMLQNARDEGRNGAKTMMSRNARGENCDRLFFSTMFQYEGYFWFVCEWNNALLRMKKDDWRAEFVGVFPNETKSAALFRQIVAHNGKLYFAPLWANHIAEYDPRADAFRTFSYPAKDAPEEGRADFSACVSMGPYVWFTPYRHPGILRLDTETGRIEIFDDWLEPINKLTSDEQDAYFLYPCVNGSEILLASCKGNAVLRFDTDTCASTVFAVGNGAYRFSGMCFDGSNYWIGSRNADTPIVKWNPDKGILKEFRMPAEEDARHPRFAPPVFAGGYAWFLHFGSKRGVKIDIKTDEMSVAEEFSAEDCKDPFFFVDCAYFFAYAKGDEIYAFSGRNGTLTRYNLKTKEKREQAIAVPEEMLRIERAGYFNRSADRLRAAMDCVYVEQKHVGVDDFLNYANRPKNEELRDRQVELFGELAAHSDGAAGAAIYARVKADVFSRMDRRIATGRRA